LNGRRPAGPQLDYEFTDEPGAPLLKELFAYWDRKRGSRRAPRRADIDPTEIPAHLPFIHLVDVLDGGADFRFRVVGTAITAGMGRDSTGKRFSEVYGDDPRVLDSIIARFTVVVQEKRPTFTVGKIWWSPLNKKRRYAGVALPLSEDDETVNMILSELILL